LEVILLAMEEQEAINRDFAVVIV